MEEKKRTREDAGLPLMREFDEGLRAVGALMELCSKYPRLEALSRGLQGAEASLRSEDARHISLFRLPTEILMKIVEGLDAVSSLCFASTCTEARTMFRDPKGTWLRRFAVGRGVSQALTCPPHEVLWRARQAGFGGVPKEVKITRESEYPSYFQTWVGHAGSIVLAAKNHVRRNGAIQHQVEIRKYRGDGRSALMDVVPLPFDPDNMTLHVRYTTTSEGKVAYVHGLHTSSNSIYYVKHNFATKERTENQRQYANLGGPKVRILPHNSEAIGMADNVNFTTPGTYWTNQHTFSTHWDVRVSKRELASTDGTRSKKYEYVFRRFGHEWRTDPLLQPIVTPWKRSDTFWTYYVHGGRLHYGRWVRNAAADAEYLEKREIPFPPVENCAAVMGIAATTHTLYAVVKSTTGSAFMNHYEMWARTLHECDARWWCVAKRCPGCGDKQIMVTLSGVTMGNTAYVLAEKPPAPEPDKK